MATSDITPADALEILRQHYGLALGGNRKGVSAPYRLFEDLVSVAVMHPDTTVAEVITPLLGLIPYNPALVISSAPEAARPRLRLCAVTAGILLEFSTYGVRDPIRKKRQVRRLNDLLCSYRLDNDPWNEFSRGDLTTPVEYWNTIFLEIGLKARWPLADFQKRWSFSLAQLSRSGSS